MRTLRCYLLSFLLDRVAHLRQLDRVLEQRRGQRLSDYLKRVHAKFATPNAPRRRRNRYCVSSATSVGLIFIFPAILTASAQLSVSLA